MEERPKAKNIALYARKSTEDKERQILSILSQKDEMNEIAKRLEIEDKIKLVVEESGSAKKARTRKEFAKLIELIDKGEIDGILTWHPDRLSRNAGDAGDLIDLMDEGKLIEIITPNQTFHKDVNNDKFFFVMLCGQAKLENDNKGDNVKRGLRKVIKNGHYPGPAFVGYLNSPHKKKGEKNLRKDLKRWNKLREMIDLIVSELMSEIIKL